MFKLFDTNGDGTFDQMEFEAAFNVLDIEVKVADLRRLIALSDKNNDGKIDFPEFNDMLYGQDEIEDLGGFVSDDGSYDD